MKLNILKILALFTLIVFSCNNRAVKEEKFSISGKINNHSKKYIYLKYNKKIDSCLVKDSIFQFSGKVDYPIRAFLYPLSPNTKGGSLVEFMLENSELEIDLRSSFGSLDGNQINFIKITRITGSKSQNLKNDFEERMSTTFNNEHIDSIREDVLYKNLDDFISKNPKSVISGNKLASLSNFYGYLSSSEMEDLYSKMDTNFQEKKDLEYINKIIERRKILDIGNIPPNIKLPNEEGRIIQSENLKGNMLLLEFWASWCGPCRRTNPELVDIYNIYKGNGFEILGVSEDKDIRNWKTAIKEDKLNWLQVIDTTNYIGNQYKITTIPYNILLDKEGKIIARNIKPKKLLEILKSRI